MRKTYTSKALDPDESAITLQNKVQMDLHFFFCRRANENIDTFTKDTFAIETDTDTGLQYVVKVVDEVTKNHKDDADLVTAMMPQMSGHRNCPVYSYEKYISKLHPESKWLWQQPKSHYMKGDAVWYNGKKIGSNPLSKFIGELSHSAGLSKVYTNHSIRVTGTTFLARNNFTDKQIMSTPVIRVSIAWQFIKKCQQMKNYEWVLVWISMWTQTKINYWWMLHANHWDQLPQKEQKISKEACLLKILFQKSVHKLTFTPTTWALNKKNKLLLWRRT